MQTRQTLKLMMASLLLVALAAPVAAQPIHAAGRPDRPPLGPFGRCLAILELDAGQQEQIRAAVTTTRETLQTLQQQVRADRLALRNELQSENPDACALGTMLLAVESSRSAQHDALQQLRTTIESFLTEEQKTRFGGCIDGSRDRSRAERRQDHPRHRQSRLR